jgi:hypothetical protein
MAFKGMSSMQSLAADAGIGGKAVRLCKLRLPVHSLYIVRQLPKGLSAPAPPSALPLRFGKIRLS